ncbi:hypothetical protein TCAP_05689 [Tolypocladium capitatum]|uniref:Uncharacterized protein n=1 Tax=Tolypocladium capitatum TaxID=45235 RepID=A0A2K3Q9Z8_9HYPO|nr:hypothetical protein TCAP_05689 [Tolypocladium capitatum]
MAQQYDRYFEDF